MNPLLRALPTDRLPHVWQVLATLLAVASVFTLCWYLSQQGLLDLAATAMSFFAATLIRQLGPMLSRKAPGEFRRTVTLIDTARTEFAEWMANRRLLSHVILAFVITLLFLVGRFVAATVMTLIASPWLALAAGLAVAAAVASPVLIRAIADGFRSAAHSDDRTDERNDDECH